ncbi:NAD(P)/FAD-dependent oxidoreductase [Aspergillus undulatus]|uniref:NAD(P)/FAD-dependent oxidoreductase n=1 Tax=Aspergillus undulatus TaxID=1810928 RepID=UPI003CCD0E06
MRQQHIVIIGGSFAGLSTAHQILQQAVKTQAQIKLTLVSRDTHLYWNIAAPRAVASAALVPDEKLFASIPDGFERARYPKGMFEFVHGTARGVDVDGKVARVDVGGDDDVAAGTKGDIEIGYDVLVLCTGSDTKVATPFKSRGSTEATKKSLHAYQERVKAARTILVVGAGATGVEVAGELAFEYGDRKKVILASSSAQVLPGPERPASVMKTAETQLRSLNVDLRLNTEVRNEQELDDNTWEITLSSGEILHVDTYIPTFGVKPNTAFLPGEFLNREGFVQVDEYLRVKGTKDVYAVGDVSGMESPQALFAKMQSKYIAKSVTFLATGKNNLVVPYKQFGSAIIGLQIGRKAGTGHYGSVRLPSFVVSWLRKTLFVEDVPKVVDGTVV